MNPQGNREGGAVVGSVSEEEKLEDMVALVRQAKKGDQDAFMELYRMHYKEMYAYACYMLQHQQDAEDVVADTVMAAFEGIKRLKDEYRFRQWIFKILSNQCKRRRKVYFEDSQNTIRNVSEDETGDSVWNKVSDGRDMAEDLTDRQWVRAAFEALSEEEKYIVNSFLFGGYKGDEIAKSLGIGSSTLRSKYRRALLKMKERLLE